MPERDAVGVRPAERDVRYETLGDQDAVLKPVGEATTVPTPEVVTVALAETDSSGAFVGLPEALSVPVPLTELVTVEDKLLVPVGEAATVATPDVITAEREPVALPIALAVTLPTLVLLTGPLAVPVCEGVMELVQLADGVFDAVRLPVPVTDEMATSGAPTSSAAARSTGLIPVCNEYESRKPVRAIESMSPMLPPTSTMDSASSSKYMTSSAASCWLLWMSAVEPLASGGMMMRTDVDEATLELVE